MTMTTISEDNLRTLLFCSVRYAVGRQSYMPSLVQNIVQTHAHVLTDQDKLQLAEEIMAMDDLDRANLGHPEIDRLTWLEFVAWLRKDALGTLASPRGAVADGR